MPHTIEQHLNIAERLRACLLAVLCIVAAVAWTPFSLSPAGAAEEGAGAKADRSGDPLGVKTRRVSERRAKKRGLPEATGILVLQVAPGGAADKAGIEPDDIILEIGGEAVSDADDLGRIAASLAPGTKVLVTILRGSEQQFVSATLGTAPAAELLKSASKTTQQTAGRGWLGVEIQTVNDEIAKWLRMSEETGALIREVDPDGPAAEAGLRKGDVILTLDRKTVNDVRAVTVIVGAAGPGKTVPVKILRQGKMQTLVVTIAAMPPEVAKQQDEQLKQATGPSRAESPEAEQPLESLEPTKAEPEKAAKPVILPPFAGRFRDGDPFKKYFEEFFNRRGVRPERPRRELRDFKREKADKLQEEAGLRARLSREKVQGAQDGKARTLGLSLASLTSGLRRRYKIKDDVAGVVITGVDVNSAAAERRLNPGDVIVEVSREPVASAADVQERIEQLKNDGRRTALLLIANADGMRFVALSLR